ncbi:MAG: ABC transporter permease [Nitrososphaerales archaeon]|nr:ABC transporter permease [Nitrososphaerales archaeon]
MLIGSALAAISVILALLSPLLVDPGAWKSIDFALRNCWNNPLIDWHIANIYTCPASAPHPLGTDAYGRDLWQMILLSIPTDIEVAFEIVSAAFAVGVTLGAVAAYAGGLADEAVLRVTDVFLAFPVLPLAIILATVVARQLWALELAVLVIWWPTYVRLSRSQVLSEKEKPYVEALRAMGAGGLRIVFRHLLPNSIYPVLVQATLDVGGVILTFAALMFLGFSPSPLLPELGNLVNDGITKASVFTSPWIVLFPGLAILLIALGFNLLGDGIRDVLDPRLRR